MIARKDVRLAPALALLATAACGGGGPGVQMLDRAALMDPETCKACHPDHYEEWSGSMHAYAADDPVFLAMNQRAQRTDGNPGGPVGNFCVQCHAPMAVRQGLTTDGMNLATLPRAMKGVTCYFCHATASADGVHNNPLTLAQDDSLFGAFSDPVAGTPHKGIYSRLLDNTTSESAVACGSCHDIQTGRGVHVERTFSEWQKTVFAVPPKGASCSNCHMPGRDGPAATSSPKVRRLHNHAFPAVDLALTPFPADNPQNERQRRLAQGLLDTVIQATLCLNNLTNRLELTLDNVSAGHNWPSGATPDRRAWVEIEAFAAGASIYASGGTAALPLEHSPDPDLWLLRDCILDEAGQELTMFWQTTTLRGNGIPGAVVLNIADPDTFSKTHVRKLYPDAARDAMLPGRPDRVTVKVRLKAIGDDVIDDLIQSGDLDPVFKSSIAEYTLGGGAALEWTLASSQPRVDPISGATLLCVSTGTFRTNTTAAVSNAHCAP
jgi:hypothetical protein